MSLEEAADLPVLSDTEAALACVLGECPRGALLADGTVPCALWHSVYAVIHLPTNVDVELERLCHANAISSRSHCGEDQPREKFFSSSSVRNDMGRSSLWPMNSLGGRSPGSVMGSKSVGSWISAIDMVGGLPGVVVERYSHAE